MRHSLLPLLLALSGCATAQTFPVSELSFDGIIATRGSDSTTIYMPLGSGFFRAPRSDDSDSLISAWIGEHPSAVVTPVTTSGPTTADGSGTLIYIWLTDGEAHLNLHLIRRGAYPGGVMTDVVEFAERMKASDMPFDQSVKRLVPDDVYEAFLDRVAEAERAAIADSLGIWINGPTLRRR